MEARDFLSKLCELVVFDRHEYFPSAFGACIATRGGPHRLDRDFDLISEIF